MNVSDDEQPSGPPIFRLHAGETRDQVTEDGSIWRVHTFYVVDEDGARITATTHRGEMPIILQAVPMQVSPSVIVPWDGLVH